MAGPRPDPSAPAASGLPGRDEDPILDIVADVVARLERFEEQSGAVLTCNDLLGIVGLQSNVLALLIFSLLNLLPAPPGYNFFMSLIIIVVSVTMLLGKEVRLTGFLGRTKLPLKLVMRLVGILSTVARWIAKASAPRLRPFVGDGAKAGVAVVGIILGVAMLIPIPAGNMIPSIGLAMACVGLLNHDGLLVIAGVVVGFIGLAILVILIWLIVALGFAIEDMVEGGEHPATAPLARGQA